MKIFDDTKISCPACRKKVTLEEADFAGFCNPCSEEGFWMDPAGGVHYGDEEDPARMYE